MRRVEFHLYLLIFSHISQGEGGGAVWTCQSNVRVQPEKVALTPFSRIPRLTSPYLTAQVLHPKGGTVLHG